MVQLWVVVCLIISAFAVSALGAAFSILGLGKLFAGAVTAVSLMAASLELAKFTIAAFLHQTWKRVNILIRIYLVSSVVILSLITSMGIFGFLSGAYQESSAILQAETIKLNSLKDEKIRFEQEIARLTRSVDEIPDSRITKKLKARAEVEPMILDLKKRMDALIDKITAADLAILDVTKKVGPLIYIGKMFGLDVDTVVKYLILAFVFVFDPLAICLVVAVSYSFDLRKQLAANPQAAVTLKSAPPPPPFAEMRPAAGEPAGPLPKPVVKMRFSKGPSDGNS